MQILWDDAAGETIATTAKRRRMFGVVVAANVDDERVSFNLIQCFQARREDGDAGVAVSIGVQHRQVAEVGVVFPRLAVARGVVRIPMAAGGKPQNAFAVFLARRTAGVFVDVKAVRASGQIVQRGGEDEAVFAFADDDFACGLVAVEQFDGDGESFVGGLGTAVVVRLSKGGGDEGEGQQGFFLDFSLSL